MGLLRMTFYSGISTTVSLVTKLVTNKIIAVYLGTNGMFLLGQLKDFLELAKTTGSFGTDNGIIKYTSEYKSDNANLKPLLNTGFKLHLYASLAVCLLTFFFRQPLSQYLFGDTQYAFTLGLLSVSIVTVALYSFFMAVFNGLKLIKTYITITIISSVLSTVLMVILVMYYDIIGAFYAIALHQVLVLVLCLFFLHRVKGFSLKYFKLKVDPLHFKNLTKFSLMALVAPLCLIGATLFVRFYLNENLGEDYAGSWEGMWRLSAIYIMFLATTFKFYLLPTFSELSGNALKREIFKVWRLSIPTILLITLTIYLLRDFIIPLLFSEEFLLINTIILFHLLGDAFKINTWVLGNVLIAKADTKAFIAFQIGWAVVFITLTLFAVNYYGFIGVSIAYFITNVIHFVLKNVYFRKLLWNKNSGN
ncbi:O-antigen translocase [Winogradskyella maritima]|uniref:O-antigen translocase n=1 Tax=Winogradskyella maritima TaxID=1517766 RepID=A0ABV8AKA2_9FLAO|nr:O-antigen translocase [Winogradskyella maritima]